ncbi:hypothetical protein PQQ77_25120 [Paraburkholderia strydomiana]|uniref:hypothetical protein n=1 Tax=Paraburkholderia strydomiana TaxID=1245417 RepID=UPI0038BC2C42
MRRFMRRRAGMTTSTEIAGEAMTDAVNDGQSERAAFEADYAMVWNAAMKENGWGGGHTADDVKALREGDTYGEGRHYLNARWEGWQARAASTSANVAQGAEAKLEFMPVDSMQHAIVCGSTEAIGALKARMERDYRVASLMSGPPAQTALTDDVLMQAIADTAARGHVWASRALSNFRAVMREAAKSPDDA